MINIGIIEDNYFQLNNYREFLEDFQECKVVFACKSMEEFRELSFREVDVNVILLDISLPGESGIQGMQELRRVYPEAKIIVLSGHDGKHYVIESIRNGANGYIIKTSRLMEIYHSILDAISEGGTLSPKAAHLLINHINKDPLEDVRHKLTKREYELLALLKEGYSYKEMADKLFVTVFTVNQHLKKVYQKLNVATKSELISKIWSNSLCTALLFVGFTGFYSNQFFGL
ncbi:response regulator [Chitinophaga sancti]|uniref:Response regulator transcription factor n=1 Tax=Chitinophaga sancti TaxID=1004 RepID=A0A1K1QVD7_9BACT|nr:response regulator transcription factor [Chitinophaga sancti]WQD61959.1 response regulator transcription factor [Chitinophaga sancti]WQG92472.1 response regulator transcription factor [Chitinophaga sancti]SFW63579.1 two component transcriptional regulator, LuxR family [Chitinophaga sancti]